MTIVMTTNKRAHRHEILWDSEKWSRKDRKSNLHHNATRRREGYKRQREFLNIDYFYESQGLTWGFDFRDIFEEVA